MVPLLVLSGNTIGSVHNNVHVCLSISATRDYIISNADHLAQFEHELEASSMENGVFKTCQQKEGL